MYVTREFQGVRHVWDIYTNQWVSELWWEWVNDSGRYNSDEQAPQITFASDPDDIGCVK